MSEPDDSWLLLRERGGDVSHVSANTRARYEQLAELIQSLPDEAPRPGWKARILTAIDESPADQLATMPVHKRRCPVWLNRGGLAIAGSCAAIALCSLAIDGHRPVPNGAGDRGVVVASANAVERPTLTGDARFTAAIRHRSKPVRGEAWHAASVEPSHAASVEPAMRREYAHVGDTLILNVKADPALELRVYGDAGEALGRCAELLDCSLDMLGNVAWLRLEVSLRAPGRVSVMLFGGNSMSTPFQNLNADLDSAHKAKIETRRVALVLVN